MQTIIDTNCLADDATGNILDSLASSDALGGDPAT